MSKCFSGTHTHQVTVLPRSLKFKGKLQIEMDEVVWFYPYSFIFNKGLLQETRDQSTMFFV